MGEGRKSVEPIKQSISGCREYIGLTFFLKRISKITCCRPLVLFSLFLLFYFILISSPSAQLFSVSHFKQTELCALSFMCYILLLNILFFTDNQISPLSCDLLLAFQFLYFIYFLRIWKKPYNTLPNLIHPPLLFTIPS